MDKKTQTWITEELVVVDCWVNVDRCRYLPDLSGLGVDFQFECKHSLDLLAPGPVSCWVDLLFWVLQAGRKEQPQDSKSIYRETLSICFPGMA